MNMQIKAGFRKEILAYFRTKKLMIIALVLIGLAVFSPVMIAGMGFLMDSMGDIYDEMGMDVSGLTGMLLSSSSTGVITTVSDITTTGLIVLLLMINMAAGGEQKKRAVIIPKSAGLKSLPYILPKFIIYPLSAFIFAIAAMFVSWGISSVVFDVNDVTLNGVLLAGVLSGVCLMLYTCFHVTLGTATGKAGMSAAICIAASFILPNIFSLSDLEYMYNPFAMNLLATNYITNNAISGAELRDIAMTIIFAIALMFISYLIALFAQNARKIDNTGDEIEL